jgi:hypothetical protein
MMAFRAMNRGYLFASNQPGVAALIAHPKQKAFYPNSHYPTLQGAVRGWKLWFTIAPAYKALES